MKKYRIMSLDGVMAEISVDDNAPEDAHKVALQQLEDWQRSRAYSKERTEMMEKYDLLKKSLP